MFYLKNDTATALEEGNINTLSIETMCITRKYPEYILERHSIVIVLIKD